jgi:phage host-nuclease inhibitor protein Gam|tara:strand:+ start:261 stop:455 length:195 start_codon:yes stop_codon:yes gene_type:complete
MYMDNERLILAIGRIERALSRIETASSTLNTSADEALEARHQALKEEMKQAIRTIDGLIERQEQ